MPTASSVDRAPAPPRTELPYSFSHSSCLPLPRSRSLSLSLHLAGFHCDDDDATDTKAGNNCRQGSHLLS